MTRWRIWLAVLALAGATLLMACNDGGDDDDDGNGGDEPTATQSADGGDETPTDGDGDGNGDGDAASLSDLAGEWATKEAKLVYEFSSTGGGTDSSGTFTLYWKPPDSWRLDMMIDGETSTLISSAGTSYLCSEAGGEGSCFATPGGQVPIPFVPLRVNGGSGGVEFSMEATSLEESVGATDFEPPYPVLDLGQ
jgi:hypothetical protein